MNIVNSGNTFNVFGEDVQTYKTLPVGTYKVDFSPMTGFSLQRYDNLEVKEKIYGKTPEKVKKVLDTFKAFNRNMGIILSGQKGSGKSLFVANLAEEGRKQDIPLIIVESAYEGLTDFLSSIKQECIVLFDEFEKTFDNEKGTQDRLLSLFDGIDTGKKLYVLTCNDAGQLSQYLINRPGRFHYHFCFNVLDNDEITAYLKDNLLHDVQFLIPEILRVGLIANFTYDILRAIVFELNNGYSLSETLADLNVEKESGIWINASLTFSNGVTAFLEDKRSFIPLGDQTNFLYFKLDKHTMPEGLNTSTLLKETDIMLRYNPRDLQVDGTNIILNVDDVNVEYDVDIDDEDKSEQMEDFLNSLELERVDLHRIAMGTPTRKLI